MPAHLSRLIRLSLIFLPVLLWGVSYDFAETDPLNRLYLVSGEEGILVRLSPEGSLKRGDGSALMVQFQEPVGIQIQFPSSVWVMDRRNRTILEFDVSLNYRGFVSLPDHIEDPVAFLILENGRWLIADALNQKIWQFTPGFLSPAPWGLGRELSVIPPDITMTGWGNHVYCVSMSKSRAWIVDSQGRLLRNIFLPDSLQVEHNAGGWQEILFVSGPKGTWMLAPGNPPEKMFSIPYLRIWENTGVLRDGTLIQKGFRSFLPKGKKIP